MRLVLTFPLAALAVAGAVLGAAPARAATDYPVCLHVYGPVTYDECSYTSIAQCKPFASGRSAECLVNPFYNGPGGPRRSPRVAR